MIIPEPQQVVLTRGEVFTITPETVISVPENNQELLNATAYFNWLIRQSVGYELKSLSDDKVKSRKNISISIVDNPEYGNEGYKLSIEKNGITILASQQAGCFYGMITLWQLSITDSTSSSLIVPAGEIKDEPRFHWRGVHLDVGRHFFPVEFIKKYLDIMALHKMNVFHWHLTDDQGWRIEIRKYPLLTEIGAWREETMVGHYSDKPRTYDGTKYGGFYTQDEIKEIVQYAAERFITVVPEIEMPGHAQAAIASYPQLGCTGNKVKVKTEWGISPYIYNPEEETFQFLEDVLTEVIELFPGKYIHIGGDEAIKDQWKASQKIQKKIHELGLANENELQSYFITRIEKFINSKGKILIGWDEILEGGLAPNATVMSWRGIQGGIEAAHAGHDVVMTPTSYCYFDYYQSENRNLEPIAIGGFLPIDTVYYYEPVPAVLDSGETKHILGAQANVWTEYMSTPEQVEYMLLPRLSALSEVVWSPKEKRDLEYFSKRLERQGERYEVLGWNYRALE